MRDIAVLHLLVRAAFALILLVTSLPVNADNVQADRERFLDLAKRGWVYDLRRTMLGRDLSVPLAIHGRNFLGSTLCLVGEVPNQASQQVLDVFFDLHAAIFEVKQDRLYAGRDVETCPKDSAIVLRFYSGHGSDDDLTSDIAWLNEKYRLGLRPRRSFMVSSPAMAQTFFGHAGTATHIMVEQNRARNDPMLEAYYKSILIEELFQAFSFGMDLLVFTPNPSFSSKLQEALQRLPHMSWATDKFKRNLLASNPKALCFFDVFMLVAIAKSSVEQTVEPEFLAFIKTHYETLLEHASGFFERSEFAHIIDPICQPWQYD